MENENNNVVNENVQNENSVASESAQAVENQNANAVNEQANEQTVVADNVQNNASENAEKNTIEPNAQEQNANTTQEVIAPQQEVVTPDTVNTEKEKEPSNKIIFIFIFIIVVCVFFLDDIINLFTADNYMYYNTSSENSDENKTSNNLINGYIEIGNEDSFMTQEDIKFYNFNKLENGVVSFDYISSKNIKNVSEKEIYILLYDTAGTLINKTLFTENEKISKNVVKKYNINLDDNIYSIAHFAKVVIFTEGEKESENILICTLVKTDEDTSIDYKAEYSFKNNDLKNYKMTKKISSKDEESEVYQRYLNELLSEKEELKKFKAIVTEDTNFLSYTVDLTDTANKDITVNYKLDTLLYDINYKETSEGWTCK